jgi:hypothetical protein
MPWQSIPGALLIVLGGGYAVLPKDWIEERLHLDPDAGSGLVEASIPLALIAAGAGLIVHAVLTRRAARRRTAPDAARRTALAAGVAGTDE